MKPQSRGHRGLPDSQALPTAAFPTGLVLSWVSPVLGTVPKGGGG